MLKRWNPISRKLNLDLRGWPGRGRIAWETQRKRQLTNEELGIEKRAAQIIITCMICSANQKKGN